jgi:aminopeptidase YwaD
MRRQMCCHSGERSAPTIPVSRKPRTLASVVISVFLCNACGAQLWPTARVQSPADSFSAAVQSHMEFLASDALAGRGSGTRDEWITATYAAGQMRRFGLEPAGEQQGFLQTVPMEHIDAAEPPVLSSDGQVLRHAEGMLVFRMRHATVSGFLRKWVAGTDLSRAVVLMPPDLSPFAPPDRMGPATIRLWREVPELRKQWGSLQAGLEPRLAGSKPAVSAPTVIILSEAAYDRIAALPEGTAFEFRAALKSPARTYTWNAVGRLPGTDKRLRSEAILLSAHIDHLGTRSDDGPIAAQGDRIYNGANDDASGVVAVLQLAEALARGAAPKRTVLFALFGSEEVGGFGSAYFVEHSPVALSAVVAALQFECLGRPDAKVPSRSLFLTGFERSDLGEILVGQGARLVKDPYPEENFFERSDNYRFALKGVVAHTVGSSGVYPDYHQPSDDLRTIDYAHMTEAIQSMVRPVRRLANSDSRPQWRAGMKPQ